MTSLERVLHVLQGKLPDRVPLFELFIDPAVIDRIRAGMSYEDFIDFADMDVVTCLTMVESPERMHWIDREKGTWRDKWGCTQGFTGEVISVPIEPPRIQSLENFSSYEPPEPADNEVLEAAKELVRRFKGRRAICAVGEAVFAVSQYLRAGLANVMMDYILHPDLAKKLAQIGVDYHVELYRRLLDEGVEIIALGDDYCGKSGPFMSPEHFGEFILPGLKTVVREIKNRGGYVIKHTDGNIWPIVDMLIDSGVDMLGPLEPAYMALDELRRHSNMKVGVVGNVDVDLLSRGSVQEVVATTKEQLARISPLGGHFMASGNSITSFVQADNFMAMIRTVQEFGTYPISPNLNG
jgi:uroporphyrinogen decarboxylase